MKRLKYYIRLWIGLMRIGLLILVQYPADTVIWVISMIAREAAGFLGVITIANVAGGLGDWGLYEICLLYSMCAIIEAMGQSFFDCVWGIDHIVRKGTMDVILVRPANAFIQVLGERMHFTALLSTIAYAGIMFWSIGKLHIGFDVGTVLFLLEFIICGTIINSGIYTIFNSLNFWLVEGSDLAEFVQTCREFAKYPFVVFPIAIQTFFTFIIPFGFVGYYPAAYLTGKIGAQVLYLLPFCAIIVVLIGSIIWRAGVNSYNSTGT